MGCSRGLLILCIIVVQERRRTVAAIRAVGRHGLVAAVCSTAATILYINALRHTSVADVAVIFAATPFVTAGLGWLWLGVSEAWTTLAASLVALLGVSIMVGGAVAEGHLIGDLLAFGMTICMAVMTADHSPAAGDTHAACRVSVGTALSLVAGRSLRRSPSPQATCSICFCSARCSSAWGWCC